MTEKRKSWRDVLPIHPACELFPPLSEAKLRVIGEDIRQHGLEHAVVLFKEEIGPNEFKFSLLEGRGRLDAMELVGINFEIQHTEHKRRRIKDDWFIEIYDEIPTPLGPAHPLTRVVANVDPYQYSISANLHRRHLTPEQQREDFKQKRDVIEKLIIANPEKSDRRIAEEAKTDHKVVSRARKRVEARGAVPHVAKRTDTKGRQQPAKRAKRTPDDFAADIKAKQSNQPCLVGVAAQGPPQRYPKSGGSSPVVKLTVRLLTELMAHGQRADSIEVAQAMLVEHDAESIDKHVDWLDGYLIEIKKKIASNNK